MDDASELYRGARIRMDAGDYVGALSLLEGSARLDPHFKTLELLGECQIHLGRLREAIIPLAAATALNDQARAASLLAGVFSELGDAHAAVRMARLALQRSPNNMVSLDVLAKHSDVQEP